MLSLSNRSAGIQVNLFIRWKSTTIYMDTKTSNCLICRTTMLHSAALVTPLHNIRPVLLAKWHLAFFATKSGLLLYCAAIHFTVLTTDKAHLVACSTYMFALSDLLIGRRARCRSILVSDLLQNVFASCILISQNVKVSGP